MRTRTSFGAMLAFALCCGCGSSGTFDLSWVISDEVEADVLACSRHGIDGIQVQAVKAGSLEPVDLVVFPCAPHHGVRSIESGDYVLYVSAVNLRGERLVDPATGEARPHQEITATVPESSTVQAGPVSIVPNPACADGVDNDGDGLVDLSDPDCTAADGESEGGWGGG